MSSVAADVVSNYLLTKETSASVISWKYFDPTFGTGFERGLVCLDGNKITGFLGLIPFTVYDFGARVQAAWSCDWYREPTAPGLAAIQLVQGSLKYYRRLYSLGGNDLTRTLFGKLAQRTNSTAGVTLHKPLRLGGMLKALARKSGLGFLGAGALVNDLSLICRNRLNGQTARVYPHILPQIQSYLERLSDLDCYPMYDWDYITWQLSRCPEVTAGMCLAPDKDEAQAVALFWRSSRSTDFWRVTLLYRQSSLEHVNNALSSTIAHIHDSGGSLVSVLVSHLENDLCRLLQRRGFVMSRSRRPLYIMSAQSGDELHEPQRLSFLDTDWAYRFPLLEQSASRH